MSVLTPKIKTQKHCTCLVRIKHKLSYRKLLTLFHSSFFRCVCYCCISTIHIENQTERYIKKYIFPSQLPFFSTYIQCNINYLCLQQHSAKILHVRKKSFSWCGCHSGIFFPPENKAQHKKRELQYKLKY